MRFHPFCRPSALLAIAAAGLWVSTLRAQETATPESAARVETVVFIRHGEMPANDEGQLTCQGLNRALALPDMLLARYGAAQFVFAPATTKKPVPKGTTGVAPGKTYSYVRALMTIEPTAVRLGLPVETRFAYDEIGGLQSELLLPAYQRATVFVAWESTAMEQLVKRLLSAFGSDAGDVPGWAAEDYDGIFVVRLRTEGGKRTVTFAREQQGLDGLSVDCPKGKKR